MFGTSPLFGEDNEWAVIAEFGVALFGMFAIFGLIIWGLFFAGPDPERAAKLNQRGLEICEQIWGPRPVRYVEWQGCIVQIDGEWWPADKIRFNGFPPD